MKSLRNFSIALILGMCMPVLIWIGMGSALYQRGKEGSLLREACAIDTDCPPGFACVNGRCLPAR